MYSIVCGLDGDLGSGVHEGIPTRRGDMEERGSQRESSVSVPKVAVGLGVEFVGSGVYVYRETLRLGGIRSAEFAPMAGEMDFAFPRSSEVVRLVYTDISV